MPPFNVDSVRARLPGRRIDWFETLDSTMIEARRDMEPGRIVGAEKQTAGMGRHGRKWISEAGAGSTFRWSWRRSLSQSSCCRFGLATRDEAIGSTRLIFVGPTTYS